MNWDLYEKRVTICGDDKRERDIEHTKEIYKKRYVANGGLKDVKIEDIDRKILITKGLDDNRKKIKALPDETFNLGEYVYFNNIYWLITSIDFDDTIYRTGIITKCNYIVKWQDEETREVINRWCYADSEYKTTSDTNKIISSSQREFVVKVPYDIDTSKIDIDRLLMLETINGKPKTYMIKNVDMITNYNVFDNKGYITWNIKQTAYDDEQDNSKLKVADYEKPIIPTIPLEIKYNGNAEIRIGSRNKTFKVDTESVVSWTYTLLPTQADKVHFVVNENNIQIKADNDETLVGTHFKLSCTNTSGTSDLMIKIVGGY